MWFTYASATMVSSVASVSRVANSSPRCFSQSSVSDCSAGVRRTSALCFSFILTAFLRRGFARAFEPRHYNGSAPNQARRYQIFLPRLATKHFMRLPLTLLFDVLVGRHALHNSARQRNTTQGVFGFS